MTASTSAVHDEVTYSVTTTVARYGSSEAAVVIRMSSSMRSGANSPS